MRIGIIIFLWLVSFSVLSAQEISLLDLNRILREGSYGNVILIKDGNYSNVNISIPGISNVVIKPKRAGMVTITGRSSINISNSKQVVLEGFSFKQNRIEELITIQNSPSCTITNNFFYGNGSQRYGAVVIFKGQSINGKVNFNTFDANKAIGVAITEGSTGIDVKNNKFLNVPNVKDVYPNSDGNGMESVQIGRKGGWASYATVEDNSFQNIIGDRSEIISVKSDYVKILGNNFIDCSGGVSLRISNNSIISANYFKNTSNSVRIHGNNHTVEGNTIVGAIVGIQLPAGNDLIRSNNSYVSAYNVSIKGNNVTKTRTPILLGNGYGRGRSKAPTKVDIVDNTFDKNTWFQQSLKCSDIKTSDNRSATSIMQTMRSLSSGKKW